ncbi:hypothetical protein [Hymenobacter antarcticus]|uniref:Dolichyl-phosphate-mannose-protein mannosyltransferase n=1 Tax=Hymenobacter antarcticus TaxID=486270 RepID=A0ABP7Q7X0_9BACT
MERPRVPGWVWAVLVAGHLLTLCWVLRTANWSFPDSDRYLQAAENIRLHGQLYARPWMGVLPQGQAMQEFTIRTLGYPVVVMSLAWAKGVSALLVFQSLLSLLNIGLVLAWWARRARPTNGQWLLALLGIVTFPAQFIYAHAVMSEILLQTAVLLMTWAALAFIKTRELRYFTAGIGAVVAALLIKPVFYPLAVVPAVLGVVLAWQRTTKGLALLGLVPVVVVALYMGWNKQRTGYLHFSSIAEINLLHYNAAGVVRQIEGPAVEEEWVANVLHEAAAQPDFAARQQLIQQRAGAILWAHPIVYARQHAQGMLTLFLDPGRFDVSHLAGLAEPKGGGLLAQARAGGLWRAVSRLPLGLLAVLGMVMLANGMRLVLAVRGFWRLRSEGRVLRQGRWVAVGLLLYVAVLTGPLGAARFLVPVWPLLLALALVGLRWPAGAVSGTGEAAPMREDQRQR